MSEEIPFETGLRMIFESLLTGIHTIFVAQVDAFDMSTKRCEIQPCFMRKYPNMDPSKLPKITDVPVVFPTSGKFSIVFPLEVGCYVVVLCSERALDKWLTQGGIVDPGDPRKFEITDAIALPGLFPLPNILAPPMVGDGIEIRNLDGTSVLKVTDTEVQLQCGTLAEPVFDYAVRYISLEVAFEELKADHNRLSGYFVSHQHEYTSPTGPATTTGGQTGADSAADMSNAKVENVRLPKAPRI